MLSSEICLHHAWCSLASDSCFSLFSVISDVLCELDPVPPVGSLLPSPVLHLQAAADTWVSTALLCHFTFAPSCFIPRQQLVFALRCFSCAAFTHAGPLLAFSPCLILWMTDITFIDLSPLPGWGCLLSALLSSTLFFFFATLCSECLCLCPWFLLSSGALVGLLLLCVCGGHSVSAVTF